MTVRAEKTAELKVNKTGIKPKNGRKTQRREKMNFFNQRTGRVVPLSRSESNLSAFSKMITNPHNHEALLSWEMHQVSILIRLRILISTEKNTERNSWNDIRRQVTRESKAKWLTMKGWVTVGEIKTKARLCLFFYSEQ